MAKAKVTIPFSWLAEVAFIHNYSGADLGGTIEEIKHGCLGEAPKRQLKAILDWLKDPKVQNALDQISDEWNDIIRPAVCARLLELLPMVPEVKI